MVSAITTSRLGGAHRLDGARSRRQRLGLFGCPLDTGNNGVSALGLSMVHGVRQVDPTVELTVFDYGNRVRSGCTAGLLGHDVTFAACYASRRYYRIDNLAQMRAAASLGVGRLHPMVRRIMRLDALLDISGGDSFSDIYGRRRFDAVAAPKLLALKLDKPLVLAPQTYGPFRQDRSRQVAQRIVRAASQLWARDSGSLQVAAELLGKHFDSTRHRLGIDVAFGLPALPPEPAVQRELSQVRAEAQLLIGLNVSGLLYNEPQGGGHKFGLLCSYREIVDRLIRRLLALSDGVKVLLIPHVAASRPSPDCDVTTSAELLEDLAGLGRRRVCTLGPLGAMQSKWVIGQCDWFCGARMHACIAALSSGVPAAGIAYSDKMRGVFETAGCPEAVLDPRVQSLEAITEGAMALFADRAAARRKLLQGAQGREKLLADQFEAMLGDLRCA